MQTVIGVAFGEFLVSRYQAWGFIVFVAIVAAMFRPAWQAWLPATRGVIMAGEGVRRAVRWIVRLAVVGGVAAALFLVEAERRVAGSFNVLPVHNEETLLSRQQLAESKEARALRRRELQEARGRLQLLLAGSRVEEIEATAAEATRLQAQKSYLQEQFQMLEAVSPIDGVIATRKLKDRIGQAVKTGDLIAKVHDLRTVTVEIAVPEQEIADVQKGQRTVLTARAFPRTRFEGQVVAIAPVVTESQDARSSRTIVVTTELANPSLLLKPEMTGQAKIYCGSQRLIDLVSRRFVRFFRVEFWSWWKPPGRPSRSTLGSLQRFGYNRRSRRLVGPDALV